MTNRPPGEARQALTELEEAPASPAYRDVLRDKLATLLRENPALLAELRDLLPKDAPAGDRIEQTFIGDHTKAAQIKGNRNCVTF